MGTLTAQDFAVGQSYDILFSDGVLALSVASVEPIADAPREGGGFRLELVGPAEILLPQAIYPLSRDGEVREIFIVPIARDSSGTRYEAIFN